MITDLSHTASLLWLLCKKPQGLFLKFKLDLSKECRGSVLNKVTCGFLAPLVTAQSVKTVILNQGAKAALE